MPPPDEQELTGRAAELLERLVSDPDLRARFRRDPASVCAEYGLLDVAEELRRGENVLETLEIRESRSSLAGALMAAVGEGVGAVDQLDEQSVGAGGSGDVGVMADSAQLGADAAEHAANVHYGFVRDSRGGIDYTKVLSAGYTGVLFHANDPDLAHAIDTARGAGIPNVGIWAPPNGESPEVFAHRLAELSKYKPSIVVPDVEAEGKGYPGSPQWQWSDTFVKLYRKLAPHQRWAVTVMPLQDDFNYGAYTSRGAGVWPQTYGATYDVTFDPKGVVDRVVANGVDRRLVNAVIAPNQTGKNVPHYASYALDDFGGSYPAYSAGGGIAEGAGAEPAPAPAAPSPAAPVTPAGGTSAPADVTSAPPGQASAPQEQGGPPAAVGGDAEPVSAEYDVPASAEHPRADSGVYQALFPNDASAPSRAASTLEFSAVSSTRSGAEFDAPGDEAADPEPELLPDGSDVYPGDDAPREAIAGWMARQAHKAGLPGELPVMAALVESGLRNLDHGHADSLGYFQMRESIWGKVYPNYDTRPELQLRWFIDHAVAIKQKRIAEGDRLFGRDDSTWGSWIADVERPAKEFEYRYQLRLEEARQLLDSPGAGTVYDDSLEEADAALAGSDVARGEAVVSLAQRYLGVKYTWGGESPSTGFDCSGFVLYLYDRFGVELPRVAEDQFDVGLPVGRDELEPGDPVFFRDAAGQIHHEGLYIGDGKFIHAPHTGDVVKISSLDEPYYAKQFAGGRRLLGGGQGEQIAAEPPATPEPATPAAPGGTGIFPVLEGETKKPSGPPRSTVQFLPALEPPEDA